MAQDHYFGMGEIDCWGLKLIDVQRNPAVLKELIEEGKFGAWGEALRRIVYVPYGTHADHETRLVLAANGKAHALLSLAREGQWKICLLTFQRGPTPFTADDKEKMFRALRLCGPLVQHLLTEQVGIDKKELEEQAKQEAEGAQ
jgi:hypothetical protein